jgi:iron complex outermembrane receptor protein
MKMKNTVMAAYIAGLPLLLSNPANAQHDLEQHHLEEVFITGEIVRSAEETALPVDSLSGEELRKAIGSSLGQTLANQQGVTSASFGTGVGLPVIRGQSGARVSVVQNGLTSLDAAQSSPDHANSVDPLVAERIEIIRGPATLLYGNGAIGGVVNVIDNRIPETLPRELAGAVEARHNTVNSETATAFKLESALGNFAWHVDGAWRDAGNTKIPGYAINEEALEPEHEEHDEHTPEHQEETPNTHGYIANSDSRSNSFALGGSWIGAKGFAGFSVSHLDTDYGLPRGSHLHAEEAHEDEHLEEEEHVEGGEHHEEEHPNENIRIDLEQTRYEFKAGRDLDGFFTRVNARAAYNDYRHTEFAVLNEEAGVHEEHEGEELHATHFTNKGFETRVTGRYTRNTDIESGNTWEGIIGVQASDSRFAVEGEEGFLPRTDIQSVGLFALESIRSGRWIYELGARLQHSAFEPNGNCSRSDTSWSASAAAIWQFSDSINTSVSVGRAQRSAGVEERYSNVNASLCRRSEPENLRVHNPTGLIEVGNPNLNEETSNNLEVSLHKHLGKIHGEVNLYFNKVNDYIYLSETGGEVGEIPVAEYRQADAEFYGYEAEITVPVQLQADRQLELTLFSDAVHAELATGPCLPRIPPRRGGIVVALVENEWSAQIRVARVAQATHLAPSETPTDGYTLVEASMDYHIDWGNHEVLIFAKGTNLLDETVRSHTSFVKDLAPEPGRGLQAGLRVSF